jgi:hypothetical protein
MMLIKSASNRGLINECESYSPVRMIKNAATPMAVGFNLCDEIMLIMSELFE